MNVTGNEPENVRILKARNLARRQEGEATGNMTWVVLTEWSDGVDKERAPLNEHYEYQLMLEEKGILFAAGGLWDGKTGEGAGGLVVIRASSYEQALQIAAEDPMHSSGFRRYSVHRWTMNEGKIRVSLTLSTGQADFG